MLHDEDVIRLKTWSPVPCTCQTHRVKITDDPRGYIYWFDPCRGYSQCPDQIEPAGADTAVSKLLYRATHDTVIDL